MHWRRTLLLVTAAVALGLYVYLSEIRPSSAVGSLDELRKKAEMVFYGLERGRVDGLVIERGEAPEGQRVIEFRRKGDAWELVRPIGARARTGEVDSLVRRLAGLARKGAIHVRDLSQYGLAPADISVTVRAGSKERALAVGALDATNESRFATVGGGEEMEVFAVDVALAEELSAPLGRWRETRLVALAKEAVHVVELTRKGGGRIALAREGPVWNVTAPLLARARKTEVERLLGELAALRADAEWPFAGYGEEAVERWGLDEPIYTVDLASAGGQEVRLRFALAVDPEDSEAPERLVAVASDFPVVFTLPRKALATLDLDLAALRDRRIMGMLPADVEAVEVSYGGSEMRLEKEGFDWKITAPKEVDAEEEAVTSLLEKLYDVRIESFGAAESLENAGLVEPLAVVALSGEGRSNREEISFGKEAGRAGLIYVKSTINEDVVAVEAVIELLLPRSRLDVRSRSIARIDRDRVVGLQIVKASRTYRADRDGDEWLLGLPVKGNADYDNVNALVAELAHLKVKRYVEEDVRDLDRFGLAQARMTLRVKLARMGDLPGETLELRVGYKKRGVEEWFATLDAPVLRSSPATEGGQEGLVFTIDKTLYAKLDAEMMDRDVLEFDPGALAVITIDGLRIERRGGKWEAGGLVEGERLLAEVVDAAVWELAGLRAERFVALGGSEAEPGRYGLDEGAALVLEMEFGEGRGKDEILAIGDATREGGRLAMLNADGRVFELGAQAAKRLELRRSDLVTAQGRAR